MTNTTCVTVGELRCYPYGETRLTTGTIYTDKLFTGQREITGLGVYDYRARFYSPYITHFTQPDSIVPDPYNPQDWDRYSYARNNPIRYTDPMGHRVCEGESNSGCKPAPTEIKVPYFVKSPVDKKHLKFTQWFGPTEFAYSNGKDWNYDKYCQGYVMDPRNWTVF